LTYWQSFAGSAEFAKLQYTLTINVYLLAEFRDSFLVTSLW
jgi:hypothetical protein